MAYFLSPALVRLRTEINALWPHRDKTSDGWIGDTSHAARPSDHNPAPPDGIVRAIDIDEDLTVGLAEVGAAMPLVNAILRDPRVRYVIYEGRIWNVDTKRWSPYSGPNAHRHHVHVSVRKVGNYDRDASPWNLAARIGNDIGSIPTVTTPTTPGAPAPLIPEDFLMTLSHDEQKKLASQVNAIYQALFYGSRANNRNYPGLLDMVVENQVRIGRVPGQVWDTKVKRSAGPVSALQDLANGTTHAAEAVAQTAGLRELVTQLAEGRDVDLDAIEERMRDVLATGVVKVEISVPTPASQPAPEDVIDVDAITKED